MEFWNEGQLTPHCTHCERLYEYCHFCRGTIWATPPPWGAELEESSDSEPDGCMFEKEEGKSIDSVQKGSEDSGVKVVELKESQKEATMDQNICMLLSDQLRHEELPALGVKQCVYQTDCAGCEHTPMAKAVKMSNNQVDHIIGQKQTQKMQTESTRLADTP